MSEIIMEALFHISFSMIGFALGYIFKYTLNKKKLRATQQTRSKNMRGIYPAPTNKLNKDLHNDTD